MNATVESVVNKRRVWLCSPGRQASRWDEFRNAKIMRIGWDELGDLSQYDSREKIRTRMKEVYGTGSSYTNNSLAVWQFSHEMAVGDIIFAKLGREYIIGRGVIESEYIYDKTRSEYRHTRKVKWGEPGKWENPSRATNKTLTEITLKTGYVEELETLLQGDIAPSEDDDEPEDSYPGYGKKDFLDEVFLSPEKYDALHELLRRKRNVILQGAPGVGKTFAARRLAFSIIGAKDENRVQTIQFHQSYSYDDFIMGYRPKDQGGFRLTEGPFYKFCIKAKEDAEHSYFFIIDEINRGNLSKIFGELLMLIESDKRGEKYALRLLYNDEQFFVPENVHIIGMMNTADRSLAMIDYALRRRFAFFDMQPAFRSGGFRTHQAVIDNRKFDALIGVVEELNRDIEKDASLGTGFCVGHSYFCGHDGKSVNGAWLSSIVSYELEPLLTEYWFDEPEKAEKWIDRLRNALNG